MAAARGPGQGREGGALPWRPRAVGPPARDPASQPLGSPRLVSSRARRGRTDSLPGPVQGRLGSRDDVAHAPLCVQLRHRRAPHDGVSGGDGQDPRRRPHQGETELGGRGRATGRPLARALAARPVRAQRLLCRPCKGAWGCGGAVPSGLALSGATAWRPAARGRPRRETARGRGPLTAGVRTGVAGGLCNKTRRRRNDSLPASLVVIESHVKRNLKYLNN